MGERIQKVANVIFSLAFVAILAMMFINIIGFSMNVNNRLSRSFADTEAYELQAFDRTKVTGSTVISAVNNRENLYTAPLEVQVNGVTMTSVSTTPGDPDYINSAASYNSSLLVNANGIVYGILFTT